MEKPRILLIESQVELRERIAHVLKLANYNVIQASDGREGTEKAIADLPQFILCGIIFPEIDGYGVLHLLRKRQDTALIPFLFLASRATHEQVRKAIELGADDYITKPFDALEVLNAIERSLRKTALLEDRYSSTRFTQNGLTENFSGMRELSKLFEAQTLRIFKKKQVIYYEGDPANTLYKLLKGEVITTKMTAEGKVLVLEIYGPDDYFGIGSLLSGSDYKETAAVLEEASVSAVPRENVELLLKSHPDIAKKFTKILARHLAEHDEQLLRIAYYSVRKRMAELLLKLSARHSDPCIEISRETLAGMAGMATETASRILSDFKESFLIDRNGCKITILDPAGLKQLKN